MIKIENLKSKKGYSLITFLVTIPFIAFFMIYLTSSYAYNRTNNQFEQITNATFDRILVEGQLTNEIKQDLYTRLEKINIQSSDLVIRPSDYIIDDGDDTSYVIRGSDVKIDFIYKKPHFFYYVNKFILLGLADEKTYYLANSATGMSEKI